MLPWPKVPNRPRFGAALRMLHFSCALPPARPLEPVYTARALSWLLLQPMRHSPSARGHVEAGMRLRLLRSRTRRASTVESCDGADNVTEPTL